MTEPTHTYQQSGILLAGQVPYSQEAEEAVLGAVLIAPEAFHAVAAFLSAEDFYILRHTYIWRVLEHLADPKTHLLIDPLTVQDELRARGQLPEVGGPAYITQLMNSTPTSVHAVIYGRLVQRAAIRRRLLLAADHIKALAMDEEIEVSVAVDGAWEQLGKVETKLEDTIKPLSYHMNQLWTEVESAKEAYDTYLAECELARLEGREAPLVPTVGVPTGFTMLDKRFGGFIPSVNCIVAGRPGMGKSAFMMNAAINACRRINPRTGRPYVGAFFSLEMTGSRLAARIVSGASGINSVFMRTGRLTSADWSNFTKHAGDAAQLPLLIDDNPHINPKQLGRTLRRLQREVGLDFAVVDYLQLMESGQNFGRNREREVSYISREIKALTLELGIPIVSGAQLNRDVEGRQDKRPMLADLRESGSLEQDADMVIFLYRPIVYYKDDPRVNPLTAEAHIAKNRDDVTGVVPLHYYKERTLFVDAT